MEKGNLKELVLVEIDLEGENWKRLERRGNNENSEDQKKKPTES